ncbi:DolP-mannose mannosyltransferase [Natronomonas gomsonensis]|uniref:DolP-mannose mannosyltransferase n=1 Tax=Natronomonas gomsonensis TaxID=1046043 RepID=UPI0015B935F1|nr:DolP-mannose mannosyltransferase [Natronomonas gomsonensis]
MTEPEPTERLRALHDSIDENWLRCLAITAAVVLVVATVVKFAADPFAVNRDSALFQHAGWYITQGATPYVDFWDLKPPLIYAVTTVLALLSGGNMAVLHVLSVFVAVIAVWSGVVVVGVLTHRLTDDGFAAVVAGLTMFVVPTVYAFPASGIRPKYFAFCFGAAALLLAVEDRPAASGAAAAVSAGFWQLGGGLAILVVAMSFQRGGWRASGRTVAGGLAVAVVVVGPFVAAGLAIPLFVETVLAPVYGVEGYTIPGRLLAVVVEIGIGGVVFVAVGAYGWLRGFMADRRRYWWIVLGGIGYTGQIFLEMQGAIELILLFTFLSVGIGIIVAHAELPSQRWRVVAVVVVLALAGGYWAAAPVTPLKDDLEETQSELDGPKYETLPPIPEGAPSMQTIYWEKQQPEMCHYRFGEKQRAFEARMGGDLTKSQCGQWPFEEPPREWLLGGLV